MDSNSYYKEKLYPLQDRVFSVTEAAEPRYADLFRTEKPDLVASLIEVE